MNETDSTGSLSPEKTTEEEKKGTVDSPEVLPARWAATLTSFVGTLLVSLAFYNTSGPLSDNSLLTHIATGRYILDVGVVPTSDIYSFTDPGAPWVVQSWFVSCLYALIESVVGAGGIRVAAGLVAAVTIFALWREASANNLLIRAYTVGSVAAFGMLVWSPRPTIFATFFFVVAFLAARGRIPAWLLIPVGALWVNSHGTWPLGIVVLGLLCVGGWVDAKKISLTQQARAAAALLVGICVGAAATLGVDLLTFPLESLRRSDVLSQILEWRRTDPLSAPALLFLWPPLVLSVLSLRRRGGTARYLLVVFAFALALLAVRNLTFANIIFFFVIIDGFAGAGKPIGQNKSILWAALSVVVVAAALASALFATPNWDFSKYPTEEIVSLEDRCWIANPEIRVATTVGTSNYLSLVYGPEHPIMLDDRFDMFDKDVIWDYLSLNDEEIADDERLAVLDRYAVDVVLWSSDDELVSALAASPVWVAEGTGNDDWVVYRRSDLPDSACTQPER